MNSSLDQVTRTTSVNTRVATPKTQTITRTLLAVGAAGPVVFMAIATLAGLITPGYNMLVQHVSDLAVGPYGWLQTANFFLLGFSLIAFAFGFYGSLARGSRVTTLLLSVAGLAMGASGIFPTDLKGAPETGAGAVHNLLFLVIFLALTISYIFSALALRKRSGWRGHTIITALMPIIVFGLMFVFVALGSDPGDPLYFISGVIQRILLTVSFGWMAVTGWRLLKEETAG